MLDNVAGLDVTRWDRARRLAREAVLNEIAKPDQQTYNAFTFNRFPKWAVVAMLTVLMIIASAAFWISAGKQIAASDLVVMPLVKDYSRLSSIWADLSIVFGLLLGELGTIFFFGASGMFPGKPITVFKLTFHPATVFFKVAGLLCAGFALLANISIAALHAGNMANIAVFGWFLTLAPPLVVLFVGMFLENLLLGYLEERGQQQEMFNLALARWHQAQNDPESHETYRKHWYTNILDQLIKVSPRNRELITQLVEADPNVRLELVKREFARHEWAAYAEEITVNPTQPQNWGGQLTDLNKPLLSTPNE